MTRPRRAGQRTLGPKLTPNDSAEIAKFRAFLRDKALLSEKELHAKYKEYLGL